MKTKPTYKAFFRKLAKHKGEFALTDLGYVRDSRSRCPIVAVLGGAAKGTKYGLNGFATARAVNAGLLTWEQADNIAFAADCRHIQSKYRKRLLKVLGLEGKTVGP